MLRACLKAGGGGAGLVSSLVAGDPGRCLSGFWTSLSGAAVFEAISPSRLHAAPTEKQQADATQTDVESRVA